ncbi:hypothetical protein [Hymenobacter glacieicola]|uniref:Glycosyltransferase RgtA/B/C/D-like domain-containing protein n=1 Tax=Hymenobacter glacieicola TaxID=1562124 RepID=A0ABQ1X3E5_9BACT|nr:hypothetical protein [Hymenobacter glacieicola]GGG57967.1 hypothetical protein GCM10011378_37570 [Hymenobacter glacieicola]
MKQPASPRNTGRVPAWVWASLLVLHAVALGWQLHYRQPLFPDSGRYVEAARNLHTSGVLYAEPLPAAPLRLQEYSIRPPGYPVLLLLTGGTQAATSLPVATLLLQNVLSLVNLGVVLRWLARKGLRHKQWAVVLLLIMTAPAQVIYANVVMSELLLQTAIVVLWAALVRFWQPTRQARYFAGAALAAAAALLIKPVFFPAAALLLGVGAVVGWQQKRPLLVVWGVVPLLVALLWMGRNEARTGYFHFSSIAEINLLRYNARGVLQATEGPVAAERFVRGTVAASQQLPGFREQQQYIQRASVAVLWRHPVAYAAQHLRGMVSFFLDPGRFDMVYFLGLPDSTGPGLLQRLNEQGYRAIPRYLPQLPGGLVAGLLLILLANVARLVLALRFLLQPDAGNAAARWGVVVIIGYVALLTGPLGASRFAVPVLPLLVAAAGAGLTYPLRLSSRRTA